MNILLEENYIHNNPTAFYDTYEVIHNAAQCSKYGAITSVTQWVDGWLAKDPEYFTTMQLACLNYAKKTFLEDVDTDEEASDEE